MSLACPVDNKDDSIQSLSALVIGGRATGSFSGPSGGVTYIDGKYGYTAGTTQLYGTMTTDLAKALDAPKPPNKMGFWGLVGWSCLFYISICIIVGPFLVWPRFKEAVAKNPEIQKRIFTPGLQIGCILIMIFGLDPVVWPFLLIVKSKIDQRDDYGHRYDMWRRAYMTWQKLYYCHRCGVVFNPETSEYFQPDQLRNYLHIADYE